ncbi:uncharacterized protein [Symphalangus syndactylus]|uniref:uncharacterized protein n=1 Tax=Symphalangus syndactylus TaxID=9590 RepID=UPI003004A979
MLLRTPHLQPRDWLISQGHLPCPRAGRAGSDIALAQSAMGYFLSSQPQGEAKRPQTGSSSQANASSLEVAAWNTVWRTSRGCRRPTSPGDLWVLALEWEEQHVGVKSMNSEGSDHVFFPDQIVV